MMGIAWDAVEFDENGQASLKVEIDNKRLIPNLDPKKNPQMQSQEAEVDFFANQMNPR